MVRAVAISAHCQSLIANTLIRLYPAITFRPCGVPEWESEPRASIFGRAVLFDRRSDGHFLSSRPTIVQAFSPQQDLESHSQRQSDSNFP
jgi:hypothetical protein